MEQFKYTKEEEKEFEKLLFKEEGDYTKQIFFQQDVFKSLKPLKREKKLKAINYLYDLALKINKYDVKQYGENYGHVYSLPMSIYDILKSNLFLSEEEIEYIYNRFIDLSNNFVSYSNAFVFSCLINSLLKQIECSYKEKEPTEKMKNILLSLKAKNKDTLNKQDKVKTDEKIDTLINFKSGVIVSNFLDDTDRFSNYANKKIETLEIKKRELWYKLILMFRDATSTKPTKSFIEDTNKIINEYGASEYKKIVLDLIDFMINLETIRVEKVFLFANREHTHTTYTYISTSNTNNIKGLIWSLVSIIDNSLIEPLTKLV